MSDKRGILGSSPLRVDGLEKSAGATRYLDDLPAGGAWWGATVRSQHPHARILSIRFDRSLAPPDAVFVHAGDIDGRNGLQILDDHWPILAQDEVHHVGEAIALVAAPTREDALRAAGAVEVEYEPLDTILGWESAEQAEPLYDLAMVEGDTEEMLARAQGGGDDELILIEGEYFSGHQEHLYIETQAMLAEWLDGRLIVTGSMQCPYYVKSALQHVFGLGEGELRVVGRSMGGAFGGKEDYPSLLAAHAALLSRAAQRPVKIVYDRHEDIIATTKRHPSHTRIRSAVRRDGTLVAARVDLDLDGGAYLGLSPVVLSRGLLHATGPYQIPNVSIRARVLRTNTIPSGAFRGFGAPQSEFAWERHMDRIGRSLGIDPLSLRQRNVLHPGDSLPTGQIMDESCSAAQVLEEAARKSDFTQRWQQYEEQREMEDPFGRGHQRIIHGLGLSLSFHGAGFTGLGEHKMRSPVTVRLAPDGKLEILSSATEMGQGMLTVLPMLAADATGLRLEDVVMHEPDTDVVPDSGPTVASRTSMIVGGAAAKAAKGLVKKILEWKEEQLGAGPLQLAASQLSGTSGFIASFREVAREYRTTGLPSEFTARNEPPAWQKFDETSYHGSAYPTYSYSAQVIEVEVDTDTLEIHTTHATVVAEVGKVLHELQCRGQIEGGTLQALGWALWEEMKLEKGRFLNDRMATYIVPTILDAPVMDVTLLESPWPGPPQGAKGVGELPMDGPAAAVCAAIENATGITSDRIPATPEILLDALRASSTGAGR